MNIIQNNYGVVNINLSVDNSVEKITKAKNLNTQFFVTLQNVLKDNEKVNQAYNLMNCGSYLAFRHFLDGKGTKKLIGANFCKNPLCPVCSWRKHIENQKALEKVLYNSKKNLYHIVLAIPNTFELSREHIRELKENAVRFIKDESGLYCNSYFLSLEIVYSEKGFHPHLHIIIESDYYIKVSEEYIIEMSKLWRLYSDSTFSWRDFYNKGKRGYTFYITGIKKSDVVSASKELTKYVLKPSSYDIITYEVVEQLYMSISRTHLLSFGGNIKKQLIKTKKDINLSDEDVYSHLMDNYAYIDVIFEWLNEESRYKVSIYD